MTFRTEKMLVDRFVGVLQSAATPWGEVRFTREFFYSRGKTDIVAIGCTGTVVAFEAKLTDWKAALQQAYRNTCFAHASYVVMPKPAALRAARYLGEFDRRRVGLCYIDGGDLVVVREALRNQPLEPWLASAATSAVYQQ